MLGFAAALGDTMDRVFGSGGKQKILTKWIDSVLTSDFGKKTTKKGLSPAAQAFFNGGVPGLIPVIKKKRESDG